jgi:hypothetical protein
MTYGYIEDFKPADPGPNRPYVGIILVSYQILTRHHVLLSLTEHALGTGLKTGFWT